LLKIEIHLVILVIGREEEIRLCFEILHRQTKNNPLLIGKSIKIK
jgi:ATP-dependent Clp protease ATP-binding subunit ClpA